MRDLIGMLIDPGTEFFELGLDAGYDISTRRLYGGEMYEKEGHASIPGGGVITGVGVVQGKDCMIFSNENRYSAGTYFPITLKKHMRAQAIAEQCGLPCIYLADSGGINLPLQVGCFADDGHFGTMFYNMCRMSAKGIKQFTLSTGGNTAGGAYIVYLATESIMIERWHMHFWPGRRWLSRQSARMSPWRISVGPMSIRSIQEVAIILSGHRKKALQKSGP